MAITFMLSIFLELTTDLELSCFEFALYFQHENDV